MMCSGVRSVDRPIRPKLWLLFLLSRWSRLLLLRSLAMIVRRFVGRVHKAGTPIVISMYMNWTMSLIVKNTAIVHNAAEGRVGRR